MTASDIPRRSRNFAALGPVPALLGLLGVLAAATAALGAPGDALDEPIVGRPAVIDGDTLDFAGNRIDLLGIDAPEIGQTCGAAGAEWRCGLEARWALINRIGRNWVTCVAGGPPDAGVRHAVCYLAGVGQLDVGEWLVAQGWALARQTGGGAYAAHEQAARKARKGLWRGAFEAPWDWRRKHGPLGPAS